MMILDQSPFGSAKFTLDFGHGARETVLQLKIRAFSESLVVFELESIKRNGPSWSGNEWKRILDGLWSGDAAMLIRGTCLCPNFKV